MEPFLMPRVSLADDEEMIVSRWLVAEGETVKEGQPVLEVETAKANMEVEAPQSGVLVSIRMPAGASVTPGDTLAVIVGPGESLEAAAPGAGLASHGMASPIGAMDEPVAAAPLVKGAAVREGDVPALDQSLGGAFDLPGALYGIPARRRHTTPPVLDSIPLDSSVNTSSPRPVPDGATEVPLSRHRVAVGRLMTESWRIPQFVVRKDIPMGGAEAAVAVLRGAGLGATLTDVMLRAVAHALVQHPEVNRILLGDRLFQMPVPVIALATDSPAGVVAPVLHDLHTTSWAHVVSARQRVVAGAREGRLAPRDLNGGTFAVSNVGPLGGDAVTPLITPPQIAILGVGAIRSQEGARVATTQLVGDHRVLDGADGARFLSTLAGLLAQPVSPEDLGAIAS